MLFKYKALSIAILGVALTACGGSGTDGSSAPAPKALSGIVVDPYISGATVYCGDTTSTVKTQTDTNGKFTFAEGCDKVLTITGGTDTGTGLAFTGKLQYPATTLANVVISPLSTIAVMTGMSITDLGTKLGLDLTKDPMLDKNLLQAVVSAHQLISQLQATLVATGITPAAAEAGIATALKTALTSATTTIDLTKVSNLPIQKLLQDAATAAGKPINDADAAKLKLAIQDNVQKVNDAIAALPAGSVNLASFKENVADVIKDAEKSVPKLVNTNYVGLTGISFGSNASYTAAQILAASATNPLTAASPLDEFKIALNQVGLAATDAKLAIAYEISASSSTPAKAIQFVFDKVNFTYDAEGRIASFKLPADTKYDYEVIGGSTAVKGNNTNIREDSFTVANGAVNFSINNLLSRISNINPAFKADDYRPAANQTIMFTVALDKTVAVNGVDGAQYTITANGQTFVGKGIQAVVKAQ